MMWLLIILFKLVVLSLANDCYLYWVHRFFHYSSPQWLRKIHYAHHIKYREDQSFYLHPIELLINTIPAWVACAFWISPWLPPFVFIWSYVEASRGHGKYLNLKMLPRWFYKKAQYVGMRYHNIHHDINEMKNLGQFLRVWDKIMKTEFKHG